MNEDYVNENGFAGVPVPQTQVSMEENSFCNSEASSQSLSWYLQSFNKHLLHFHIK